MADPQIKVWPNVISAYRSSERMNDVLCCSAADWRGCTAGLWRTVLS